jgi:ferrous iron transport protein B
MINQNIMCFNRQPKYRKNFGFNQLTGLNQQVGNYPGITVEKKLVSANYIGNILDLLVHTVLNASSIDENVVLN